MSYLRLRKSNKIQVLIGYWVFGSDEYHKEAFAFIDAMEYEDCWLLAVYDFAEHRYVSRMIGSMDMVLQQAQEIWIDKQRDLYNLVSL